MKRAKVGGDGYEITAETLGGEPYTLSENLAENATLLIFWATWSQKSLTVLEDFSKIHAEHSDKGLTIVAVNDSPRVANARFVTNKGQEITANLSALDVDGDSVFFELSKNAGDGLVAIVDPNSGLFTYTPDPEFTGTDTFAYLARDSAAAGLTQVAARFRRDPAMLSRGLRRIENRTPPIKTSPTARSAE